MARRDVAARGGDGQLLSRRDRLRRNRASFDRGAVRRGDGSGKGDRPAGRRDDVAAVAVVVKPGARTGGRASDQRAAGTEVEVVAGVEVGDGDIGRGVERRSEERRVGKECVIKCTLRGVPTPSKKK